jgi:hypothetical protein
MKELNFEPEIYRLPNIPTFKEKEKLTEEEAKQRFAELEEKAWTNNYYEFQEFIELGIQIGKQPFKFHYNIFCYKQLKWR